MIVENHKSVKPKMQSAQLLFFGFFRNFVRLQTLPKARSGASGQTKRANLLAPFDRHGQRHRVTYYSSRIHRLLANFAASAALRVFARGADLARRSPSFSSESAAHLKSPLCVRHNSFH